MSILAMRPRTRSRQAGFTLVELMVVLVVIGIVSAIAIPNMKEAIQRARRGAAYQSVREINNSILRYMVEYDAPPPMLDNTSLQELVDAKILKAGEARRMLANLDGSQIFWYFSWSGWNGSDYWYGLCFRPKGDSPLVWCYLFPDGLWRWDPAEGWHSVD